MHAQNSNISGNQVGSVGTLLGYGGGVYVADHCTNGVCGLATATLTNNQIDGNYAHEACMPERELGKGHGCMKLHLLPRMGIP